MGAAGNVAGDGADGMGAGVIGWTLCSGIGAPEVAAPWVDWRLAAEIEAFPRAVLQARFVYSAPPDHNQGDPLLWGDMTEVTPDLARRHGVPLPDLLVAGTPCQAFSVAGLRGGVKDPRGNLTLKFVETCHAIVAARPDGRLCVVWENVPGVLSDGDNAFGCFLAGLVGAMDPLPPPGDGSWPGEGMVQGPRARAAWAVLDAQWFGVAQRRRRVFVVVDFGGAVDPAAVLLEPDRLRGDTAPRREAGQDTAGTLSARTHGGGGLGTDFELGGGQTAEVIASTGNVAHCLNAGGMGRIDYETETMVAHSLRAEGFDASEDGTGRGTPLVPVAYRTTGNDGCYETGDVIGALNTATDPNQHVLAFAIQERAVAENPEQGPQGAVSRTDDCAYTLEARNKTQAVAFAQNQRGELRTSDVSPQLTCGGGKPGEGYPAVMTPWALRRLTPTECHRLQGFRPSMYRVRIAPCRFLDLQKSLASVADRNLKSQRYASNADDQRFAQLAKSAESISITVRLSPGKPVAAIVRIHCEQGQAGKNNAERLHSDASIAVAKSWYHQCSLGEDIARQIVHMMHEQERIVRSQKPGSGSTILDTGSVSVGTSGVEKREFASDAVISIEGQHQPSTFITSHLGQSTQVCVSTPKTWLSCVANAIFGCIPQTIPSDCSCAITFEREEDHCAITYRNKPAADGPQYKALGNSMAVPVMRWILDRVRISAADMT